MAVTYLTARGQLAGRPGTAPRGGAGRPRRAVLRRAVRAARDRAGLFIPGGRTPPSSMPCLAGSPQARRLAVEEVDIARASRLSPRARRRTSLRGPGREPGRGGNRRPPGRARAAGRGGGRARDPAGPGRAGPGPDGRPRRAAPGWPARRSAAPCSSGASFAPTAARGLKASPARARSELVAAGAKPRRDALITGRHALTASELRVARLAAWPGATPARSPRRCSSPPAWTLGQPQPGDTWSCTVTRPAMPVARTALAGGAAPGHAGAAPEKKGETRRGCPRGRRPTLRCRCSVGLGRANFSARHSGGKNRESPPRRGRGLACSST